MSYTINLTDGTIYAVIPDGTINTTSNMVLVGKNYAGYGEFLDENFIHLLENGANTTAPGAPLVGQLFYNKTTNTMQVFKGGAAGFKNLGGATAQASPGPTNNTVGDLWFDTTNNQLKVWNGTSFTLVGPASSSGQGTSGLEIITVTDSSAQDHVVLELFAANVLVATVSKDATFTPASAISGFSTISPGIQLSTAVSGATFRGTATSTSSLNGLTSSQFMRSDTNTATTGTLGVTNDNGITVGLDGDGRLSVTAANSQVALQNLTSDANLALTVNRSSGGVVSAVFINGASGAVSMPVALAVTGTVSLPEIIKTGANGVGNIGSATSVFNTVFAKATSAQYADVAERFAADSELKPGTVVEIGGLAEITASLNDLSENVFGVISTRAAYLMNSGAGDDRTHPPVAMTGRVPVRAVGSVRKGDRLVSAGNGIARAALPGEATSFNTIGRALEDKLAQQEGMVESIVTIR
jgi:hypothetical protein